MLSDTRSCDGWARGDFDNYKGPRCRKYAKSAERASNLQHISSIVQNEVCNTEAIQVRLENP